MRPDVEITIRLLGHLKPSADDDDLQPERAGALLATLDQHEFDLWNAARVWLNGD